MKKYKILFLVLIILLVCGCRNSKDLTSKIEINSTCTIRNEIDTHGGFLGDGEYFAKLECEKINENELSSNWKKLPLTSALDKATGLINCFDDACKNIYDRYNIPSINNGYYYFIDRHSDSTNKFDDTLVNERSSYNYTIAFLDIDSNIIYYYEIDT